MNLDKLINMTIKIDWDAILKIYGKWIHGVRVAKWTENTYTHRKCAKAKNDLI